MTQPAFALVTAPLDPAATNDNDPALSWKGIDFTTDEINDPCSMTEEKKTQIVDKLCENLYYTEYYDHQRSSYDLKFCHKLAEVILDAKREGRCVEEALESSGEFGSGGSYDDRYEEAEGAVTNLFDEINEARENLDLEGNYDEDELREELRDTAIEQTQEKDDSSIMDLIGSYDKFEIAFNLSPSNSIEDNCITSTQPWADYSKLCVDDGLVGALGRMGISLKEYRAHSGNALKTELETRPTAKMKHKVWAAPLANLEQLQELVKNACSTHFILMVYAQVSLTDLMKVDINQPLMLSQYSIASYNGWNGTFHDICMKAPVVIDPKRANILLPGNHYSPDEICGLVGSYYTADLSN